MTKREILLDTGYEDSIIFENPDYDSAIVGEGAPIIMYALWEE